MWATPDKLDYGSFHQHGEDYLTREEETELFRQLREGTPAQASQARDQLFKSLFDLVIKMATEKYNPNLLPLEDVVQEGSIGLMEAIDGFDASRGTRLSSHAIWKIRHSVGRANANAGRTVRLPTHIIAQIYRVNKTERELATKLNRFPTPEEVGKELGMTPTEIESLEVQKRHCVSLDAPLKDADEGGTESFVDAMPDERTETAFEEADSNALRLRVVEAIATLTPREQHVLRERYGMNENEEEKCLQDIADPLKLSRERIRQIEGKALRKLRGKPTVMRSLREFCAAN